MSNERRFDEKEIAVIFGRAAKELEDSRKQRLTGEGLSLAELQEIGGESGIPPEFIARAAFALDHKEEIAPNEKVLGIPIGTSRTLDLPRRLTDEEWDELVVDLRMTFNAKGKIEQGGSFRQWTNGNLQFLLEPNGEGSRLRMKTIKGSAKTIIGYTIAFSILGLIMLIASQITDNTDAAQFVSIMVISLIVFGIQAYSVTRWKEERAAQMASIGARLIARMDTPEQISSNAVSTPEILLDEDPLSANIEQPASRTKHRA